jgi:hypothetical protein
MAERSVFHELAAHGATARQLDALAKTLASSPKLNHELSNAIQRGDVQSLGLLEDGGPDGKYEPSARRLNVRASLLDHAADTVTQDKIAWVVGHEVSHAMQRSQRYAADVEFGAAAGKIAASGARNRDYTGLLGDYDHHSRREEAVAELNGLNTLADRMRQENRDDVGLDAFVARARRSSSCVESEDGMTYRLDPRIRYDAASESFPVDARNIDAVATCFYDIRRPAGEYRYDTAAHAITVIARKEFEARKVDPDLPVMGAEVDFKALQLDPEKVRRLPIDLGPHRDGPFYLIDKSDPARRVIEIPHTPERARGRNSEAPPLTPEDRDHGDHAMYAQARNAVAALDASLGKQRDEGSDRLTASLLVLAKENGLQRIDHVVLSQAAPGVRPGENVFVVQGELNDPAHLRAHMKTDQATAKPVGASFQQLETVNQRHNEQQSEAQQLTAALTTEPARTGFSR